MWNESPTGVDLPAEIIHTGSMTIRIALENQPIDFPGLIQLVEDGEIIIVTRGGLPVAKMIQVSGRKERRPVAGIDAGKVVIHPDFNDPLPEFDPV